MKKLVIAATALLLSLGVNAQQAGGADVQQHTIGGVKTSNIVAGGVAASVLVAVIANSKGTSLPDTGLVCGPGEVKTDDGCVTVTTTATSTTTGTVTGTATGTTTVTVTNTF
ncbi:hypothetical protein [Rheinheimera salexigens]|uniref:Uncharacterized protein n=1 Tax=Rheinheimera salexigens TaxID=1628148 RepID=A0A1E7Q544_9GAMM|nr:hypothetical protein [Rheinheimera salexigens]OEY69231.1 hypothetical protein BI198_06330 [Rheinheimera salexigens]